MLFNLLQFKGKSDAAVAVTNAGIKADSNLRMPQLNDSSLDQEQTKLLQEYSSLGVLKGKIEKLLGVIKKESFLKAKNELGFEVEDKVLSDTRKERFKLEQELSQLCNKEGIDFNQTLGKKLNAFSERFQEKTKEILSNRVEEQLAKRSFYEKLSSWGTMAFRSYLKVEEFALEAVGAIAERVSVFSKEFFINGKSFNKANELGITAAAASILALRNYYQDKYQDSFWGDDKKFSGTGDIQACIKLIPISPLSDLVFGSAIGLIDLAFKDELGNFVYNSWNNTAIALNYEEARITNRKEFIRWWGHGVEAIEVLGAATLIASSGGMAGIGLAEKAFRVSKYLGSSGTISFLSAVSQEWVDEKPDDYFRALENAGTNMGSSALFVFGLSRFSQVSSIDKAASLNNKLLTKAKISGVTAKAIDFLDDGGDILEAGEQLAETGLGQGDKQYGAALGMGVALYSARDTNPNKVSKLNSSELNALLPEIEELLLPEIYTVAFNTKHHRKTSCTMKILGEEVSALRSPDGKRYYLEEGQIRKKYFEDRLIKLVEYNNTQDISNRLDFLSLEQIARRESQTKIAYTDVRKGVCYLPIITNQMQQTLSPQELTALEIYYRSVEIHEVDHLNDPSLANIETDIDPKKRRDKRRLAEKNAYSIQGEFNNRWTGSSLYPEDNPYFDDFLETNYSSAFPSSLAAADQIPNKQFKDFPRAERLTIFRNALFRTIQLTCFKNDIERDNQNINNLISTAFGDVDYANMTNENIAKTILPLLFGNSLDNELFEIFFSDLNYALNIECAVLNARAYYGVDGLTKYQGRLLPGQNIVIDFGVGAYGSTRELLIKHQGSLILGIEPRIYISQEGFALLLQTNPNLICFIGQGEDLDHPDINKKANIIYILFPAPKLFSTGELLRFIDKFLAPSGEVVLVTDKINTGIQSSENNFIDRFIPHIRRQKGLLTEIKRVVCQLLPDSLKTFFYGKHFSDPNRHYVLVKGNGSSTWTSMATQEYLLLKSGRVPGQKLANDAGKVGDLSLGIVKITNVQDWQRESIESPAKLGSHLELSYLTNQQGEAILVIDCFDDSDLKIVDFIFRKDTASWKVFHNRTIKHDEKFEREVFSLALSLFSKLAKKDNRFETTSIETEVDWERLGVRSTNHDTIDQAVQNYLQTNESASLSDWQYQGYRLTSDDQTEATGVFLIFNINPVVANTTASPISSSPEGQVIVSNDFQDISLKDFPLAVQKEIVKRAIDKYFLVYLAKDPNAKALHEHIIENLYRKLKKPDFKQMQNPNFIANQLSLALRMSPNTSTIQQITEHLSSCISSECDILNAREYYQQAGDRGLISSPENSQILSSGLPIIIDYGAAFCHFSKRLHQSNSAIILAIEPSMIMSSEKYHALLRDHPRIVYYVGQGQDLSDSRVQGKAEIIYTLFPMPNLFYQGVLPKFFKDFLAPNGQVVLVTDAGNREYHPEFEDVRDIPFANFLASLGVEQVFLTETRRLNSSLLPASLHSTFYQNNFANPSNHLVSIGGAYASTFQAIKADELLAQRRKAEADGEVFEDLGEVINFYLDVVKIENTKECQRVKVELPTSSITKVELWQLTNQKGEEKLVVSCLAKDNSKIMDVIFRKRENSWEVFYNRAPGHTQEIERKAFLDALSIFSELSKKDPRFKTNTLAIELDWYRLGIISVEQSTIDTAVQSYLQLNSLSGWQYQDYRTTITDTREATGVFLRFDITDTNKQGVAASSVPTNIPQIKDFEKRFKDDIDIGEVLIELRSYSAEQVYTYLKDDHVKRLLAIISSTEWGDTFKIRVVEFFTAFPRLVAKHIDRIAKIQIPYNIRLQDAIATLLSKIDTPETVAGITESLSTKFWQSVVTERDAFIADVVDLAKGQKISLTQEQASKIFSSPEFEKLSIVFFEGTITPTQYQEELSKKFQENGINPDNLKTFLLFTIQSFANRFIALSSIVFVPYSPETFYKDYLSKVYQTAVEIKDKKVGCMFARPSLVSGKFFFMPSKKGNEEKCAAIGYKNFIDHSELEVLYYLLEENPVDHAQAGDVVYDLYQKIIKASFERLQKDLAGKKELTFSHNTAFSILSRTDISWKDLEKLLSLKTVRKLLLEMMAVDRYVGIVPQYYDRSGDILDQLITFGMSPTYMDCATDVKHPRWASYLGVFVNRQREINNTGKLPQDQINLSFKKWYEGTIGFKYAQAIFIGQHPINENDIMDIFQQYSGLIIEELLTKMPELFMKTVVCDDDLLALMQKNMHRPWKHKRL